jgi:hypothetical protein
VIDFNYAKLEVDLKEAGAKDTSATQGLDQDVMAVLREYCKNSKIQLIDNFKN